MSRERPREERFLRAGTVVSLAGCVAVHGRSDFHAGSVAGRGAAGGQERDQHRADKGVWWMMTWRSWVKSVSFFLLSLGSLLS